MSICKEFKKLNVPLVERCLCPRTVLLNVQRVKNKVIVTMNNKIVMWAAAAAVVIATNFLVFVRLLNICRPHITKKII